MLALKHFALLLQSLKFPLNHRYTKHGPSVGYGPSIKLDTEHHWLKHLSQA